MDASISPRIGVGHRASPPDRGIVHHDVDAARFLDRQARRNGGPHRSDATLSVKAMALLPSFFAASRVLPWGHCRRR